MKERSIYRLTGDGDTHYVEEVWFETTPPCDMVGIDETVVRKEKRVFEGTVTECSNYIKQKEDV